MALQSPVIGSKDIVSMLLLLHPVYRPFGDAPLEYEFVNLQGFQTPSHMLYICTFRPTTLTILALPILTLFDIANNNCPRYTTQKSDRYPIEFEVKVGPF